MSSTPEVSPANDVIDARRLNAIKNQKENDWFGHDAGNRTPSGPRPASSCHARTPNRTSQESDTWFRYDVNGTSSLVVGRPETEAARRAAKEKVYGSQQEWYKHGDDVPDPPSLERKSKTRSRKSACAEVRQKATDPNEWYRHDHEQNKNGGSDVKVKVTPPTALWATDDGKDSTDLTPRPKSRLTAPEADDYYRRDKLGSSTIWFSHEHPASEDASGPAVRVRGTPEMGEIANRLKGESEDWFSHDGSKNYVAPLPVVKGNSPLAKELMERAQGREIKQIFQMEEKLRATWTAPPPLTEAGAAHLVPAKESEQTSNGKNCVVNSVPETAENQLRNGH